MDAGATSTITDAGGRPGWTAWLTPPRALPKTRGWARGVMLGLWLACLALALFAQIGTTVLVVERMGRTDPAFALYGLSVDDTERDDWAVLPLNDADGMAPWAARIVTIDGTDVSDLTPEEAAARLEGPPGRTVVFGLSDYFENTPMTERIVGSEALRDKAFAEQGRTFMGASQIIDVAVALALMAGAIMLRVRRFDQPVAVVFSFALLLLATVGATLLWARLGVVWVEPAVDAAWLSLLLVGIPALPTGRYVPSWSRWFMVAGPVLGVLLALPGGPMELAETARMALLAVALACVLIRFRYTPKGLERQQMKWACLGLAAGLILYVASQVLKLVSLLPDVIGPVWALVTGAEYFLHRIAYLVLGAGVLVALLRYRLNDADAAIGRSTGYALVTGLIAVIWAFGAAWIDTTLTVVTGASNPTLATGLSTLAAMAILAPAQKKVLGWMEARFQRALVRLRDLPARLARLRHHGDPAPVADAALRSIVDGVNATRAALVTEGEGGVRVLAAHNVEPGEVEADVARDDADRRLAVRYPLRDLDDNVGWLLLGPRSDGASYSGDERRALHSILDPLADAIRLTTRRQDETAALKAVIAAMEARVARVEAERDAKAAAARRRPRPRARPA